jgi:hypothetical protein
MWKLSGLSARASKCNPVANVKSNEGRRDECRHVAFSLPINSKKIQLSVYVGSPAAQGPRPFDPFPFQFLTFVVSLEAIFLSLFILMSQSRSSSQADARAHLDFQINLLSEQESTKMLKMLRSLCRHHGLADASDPEVEHLEHRTEPEELLRELKESLPGNC